MSFPSVFALFRAQLDEITARLRMRGHLERRDEEALLTFSAQLDEWDKIDARYDELEGASAEIHRADRDLSAIGAGIALGHLIECQDAKTSACKLLSLAVRRYARAAAAVVELEGLSDAEPVTKRLRRLQA